MVTKSTRVQGRRTNTDGKVPTSVELLEGETFLNLKDHKLYSKDAAGAVFEIGGRKGKVIGDVVSYEASGLGSIRGIMASGDATVFARTDVGENTAGDYTNFWFY